MTFPKKLERKTIYKSSWVNLHVDRVEMPGGRIVDEHHVVDYPKEGVGVLVLDQEERILMIRSYRYIIDSIEWEIPAGSVEKGESVIQTGRREVLEESGYETQDAESLFAYYPSIGISNQMFHIIKCRAGKRVGLHDVAEVAEVKWLLQGEVKQLIDENKINDGLSLTALLWFFRHASG
ncbi:MAG: NUDIX hydrolase [Candidatus Omnitrophota bacterium]|nr:NUDIX hydrolase [Candidatus Omnitrophota bacterium]